MNEKKEKFQIFPRIHLHEAGISTQKEQCSLGAWETGKQNQLVISNKGISRGS